ncbi:uncharacterized protein KY384_003682 [Bacidia gigantensis]|uniref:uncharacterized protein n=1 Tax=Bacidia gigantensis TaxID=2732470 RepID=UPI001D03C137|nr:uncharacterized protein KY384_003682 [Bacidia gigantensis]KAG8532045.1 hypothetical protein KY384_003682 [Bacidia gigantensis]
MPPTLYNRLSSIVKKQEEVEAPMLSTTLVVALSVAYTALFVLPFYLSPTTRPSPTLSRDAPSVIRERIRFVTASITVSTCITSYMLSTRSDDTISTIAHSLGLYPINLFSILKTLFLTALLFAGPLFEKGVAEGGHREWLNGRLLQETLSSWIGWRNYIAGPFTEELLFRSNIVSLHTHARPLLPAATLTFATPLYFGIAHVHHFYEYKLTHPYTPWLPALLRSVIQFGYTTVFGWYATFIFLRTGSLWAVVLIHAQCNWMGLPRIWGRVGGLEVQGGVVGGPTRGKEDSGTNQNAEEERLGFVWTVMYYSILVVGAFAWWQCLWILTESDTALADIKPPLPQAR